MLDELTTPPCVFCGEPTHMFVRNDGGCYSGAVMCDHCDSVDSTGPIRCGSDIEDVKHRAIAAYERATIVRDRLLKACQRLIEADDADDDAGIAEAIKLARDAVRKFVLSSERR